MGERTAHGALVAAPFTVNSGYTTPAVGDKVTISDDYEVNAVAADGLVLGEVFAINEASGNVNATLTVELRGQKIDRVVASGGVSAGALVKIAGVNSVATWISGAGLTRILYGIALEAALDTESLDVLVL